VSEITYNQYKRTSTNIFPYIWMSSKILHSSLSLTKFEKKLSDH